MLDKPDSVLNRSVGSILSQDQTAVIQVDDIKEIALPLYEGRIIRQFDFSEKGWVRNEF